MEGWFFRCTHTHTHTPTCRSVSYHMAGRMHQQTNKQTNKAAAAVHLPNQTKSNLTKQVRQDQSSRVVPLSVCLSVCLSASKLPVCLSDLHNLTCAHLCGQPTHSHATYSTHASHPHREESSTQPSMRCHVSQPGYPSPFLAASQTDELRLTHPSRPQRESSSKSIYSA